MAAIAFGDLASAVLAVIAALLLHYRMPTAITVAWLVNIVTSLDSLLSEGNKQLYKFIGQRVRATGMAVDKADPMELSMPVGETNKLSVKVEGWIQVSDDREYLPGRNC